MNHDLLNQALELIKKCDAAYLTTIDAHGFPSTRAMLNLKNGKVYPKLAPFLSQFDHDLILFFTTNTSSTKISQIKNNQKVAVYYCDPKTWHGLMVQGEIEIVHDRQIKHAIWLNEWTMYYPEGKDSEDYAILKLKPTYIKSYFQFSQNEMKL